MIILRKGNVFRIGILLSYLKGKVQVIQKKDSENEPLKEEANKLIGIIEDVDDELQPERYLSFNEKEKELICNGLQVLINDGKTRNIDEVELMLRIQDEIKKEENITEDILKRMNLQ